MFSIFRREKPYEQQAWRLYRSAMKAARQPAFYTDLAVPDTMDGRFDLLLVHLFFILDRILESRGAPDSLAQALFDVCFENVDQALRESGVGDMGIKKHMKRMMLAFNGRMHAYDAAVNQEGDDALRAALARNLYGTLKDVDKAVLDKVAVYMRENVDHLARQPLRSIRNGQVSFLPLREEDQDRQEVANHA